jgi:hypothetical protein
MARQTIDIGAVGNDGTGDSIRDSFRKVNDNFRELYSSLGLGERLKFTGLEDAPSTYVGQNDTTTGNTPVVTVNNTESGLAFKQLIAGNGISLDFTTNPNQISINSDFAEIVADPTPQLGGDLSMRSGGNQFRIIDAGTTISPLAPIFKHELVNKNYADSKIARAGVNAIDPTTGNVDESFGRMSGPLILSRSPEPDDDSVYGGLIAATKSYVDSSAFGSSVNLYVALSGADERPGVSLSLQGRALAYAYRTLEAALKRAEELVLESRPIIGPYEKTLTFNGGITECSLTAIDQSPTSGAGFAGAIRMSVDTVTLTSVGTNYYTGDILELVGGTVPSGGGKCFIEVLSTLTTPGAIVTFKIVSTGVYQGALPGSTNVATVISSSAAPVGIGAIGVGAQFNVTYKVGSVSITNGGTGYSLVSVRITGGGGTGAFGTAVVTGGVITSITITNKGAGFTSLPTFQVDLPRFLIYTAGLRTDFTGDVTTSTAQAIRGRDIREGLFLKGKTSNALAQIVAHSGALESGGNEIFDVDIIYGTFEIGESITYGDIARDIQITVLVESGEYYENYPLKVPANVSIVGDEFRRVIFRPRPGTSSSPWAFQKFRRDLEIDGLTTATQEFGYHYLQDSSNPVYPKIDNKGGYNAAADLIRLNRSFLQDEIVAWINYNIVNNVAPFTSTFTYDRTLCKRDIGLLVDAFVFDLDYGEYNRTISAGLKYYQSSSGLVAITTQLSQYIAVLAHLEDLMQDIITNTEIVDVKQTLFLQVIDPAFQAEVGAAAVITDLLAALQDVIDGSGSVNYPKENEEMDVFLANDTVRWQAISAIGHGGFMAVLDPQGQILSRSPYFQECASFSRSKDRQVFAGGMFIDGFAGNLEFNIDTVVTPTRLSVSDLERFPELPGSFIVEDQVYRINYVRDFVYNKNGSTATFVLDETTPWPFQVFTYDSAACSRDTGLILDGLGRDIVLGTNYWTRQNGITYRLSQSSVVIQDQRTITIEAIEFAHNTVNQLISAYPTIQTTVSQSNSTIADILRRGVVAAPGLSFTLPAGLSVNVTSAYTLLVANKLYAVAEITAWITNQIATPTAPFTALDTFAANEVEDQCRQAVEAVIHDLIYGGNLATRTRALKFYNNLTGAVITDSNLSKTKTAAWHTYLNYLLGQVVQDLAPAVSYSALSRTSGTAATATEAGTINTLMTNMSSIIDAANFTAAQAVVAATEPSFVGYTANNIAARTIIQSNKSTVQAATVAYVDFYGNRYEVLMPGNRSMLGNDFTQINDMGYGVVVANGGLSELVSIFTYYCYIAYYSLTGGQIRSVAGSNAHGIYALVAEGADPLEVPTPTDLYEELSQGVTCYFPSGTYANVINGLLIFVTDYEYTPLGSSELEVVHGNAVYRYPVTSTTTTDLPAGVCRLNLSTGTGSATQGLFAAVPDGTKMTLRMSNKILLTGGLEDVAVRPSTGLKLRETPDTVYRVLQFNADSDENGPYDILVNTATPTVFKVTLTITDIASDVCTTSGNHKLRIGDRILPTSTANGFTSGVTYFIKTVPAYNQFTVSTSPGGTVTALVNGSTLTIKAVKSHKLVESYTISFSTTGTLPAPLLAGETYYVSSTGLTETEFRVSTIKNGPAVSITTAGSGIHRYNIVGLTLTNLRENYDYIDITILNPGEFISSEPTGRTCTISIANPAEITLNSHGFVAGDVIKFTTTGSLPSGINTLSRVYVLAAGLTANTFRISGTAGGTAIETTGSQSGTHKVGLVSGRAGDDTFAVVAVDTLSVGRAQGSKFVWRGEEYIISTYQSESVTNEAFGRVILNRVLVDAINNTDSSYTIKAGVAIRGSGSLGTLTIRISLTRVTGHDLLEIGTGSYADTNYPSEIFGAAVNALDPDSETAERDVGRCFYVTTDQFGNFSVGPFFRVDQGTGQVTFSSSIALSNLDGIGFKRGVPVSEFSTDSGMTDNATDTVPTENATRIYIERRLGLGHDGGIVAASQLLPVTTGGYMALDGQLGMKANMNLNFNKIFNVTDPTNPQDAVNLRSLTFDNFQELVFEDTISAAEIPTFIGAGPIMINASIGGDLSASLSYSISTTLTGAYYDDSSVQEIDSGIEDESNVQVSDGIVVASYASFPDSGYIKINDEVLYYAAKVLGAGAGAPTANRLTGILRAQLGSTATSHAAGSAVYSLSNVTHNLQIVSGSIINADVNATADIVQSKLSMTIATEQASAPSGTAAQIQAANGLSSFNSSDFVVTNGWVTLKPNSVQLGDLEQMAADTLIGNSTASTANAAAVAFTTVVDEGLAVKKSQYSTVGFLRRTGAATAGDANFVVVAGSAGSSASVGASEIIVRDSNGDFGGRTIDVSNIKIDTQLSIDSTVTATGGYLQYYGYNSAGGILIQDGSLVADKKTAYWNNSHEFKTQDGLSNAPITCSTVTATSVQAQTLTTGGNTTAGTITGRWTLSGTSPNESRLQATYSADLAENYEGDRDYEVGTVLVFGGDKEVTATNIKNDTRVAGVVSNTAAYTMYEACPGLKNLVALQGRVPCKVVGKIKKGDILVTSGIPGVAAAAQGDVKVGTVVGKALKDYDSDHIGLLEIAVGRT